MLFYVFLFGQRNFENNSSEGQDWQSNNLKKYQIPNNSNFKCSQSNNMHQLICKYSREVTIATTITTYGAVAKMIKICNYHHPNSKRSTDIICNRSWLWYRVDESCSETKIREHWWISTERKANKTAFLFFEEVNSFFIIVIDENIYLRFFLPEFILHTIWNLLTLGLFCS